MGSKLPTISMGSLVRIFVFVAFCLAFTDASVEDQNIRSMIHRHSRDIGTIMEDVKHLTAEAERMEQTLQEVIF